MSKPSIVFWYKENQQTTSNNHGSWYFSNENLLIPSEALSPVIVLVSPAVSPVPVCQTPKYEALFTNDVLQFSWLCRVFVLQRFAVCALCPRWVSSNGELLHWEAVGSFGGGARQHSPKFEDNHPRRCWGPHGCHSVQWDRQSSGTGQVLGAEGSVQLWIWWPQAKVDSPEFPGHQALVQWHQDTEEEWGKVVQKGSVLISRLAALCMHFHAKLSGVRWCKQTSFRKGVKQKEPLHTTSGVQHRHTKQGKRAFCKHFHYGFCLQVGFHREQRAQDLQELHRWCNRTGRYSEVEVD